MTQTVYPGWHPVACSTDAPRGHVAHAMLHGAELAVWRDDQDRVNVWANRCPHRGVRLSVGENFGPALRCTYHGWRFESQTGACTEIPAHPQDTPSAQTCTRTYRSIERHGLIWVSLDHDPTEFREPDPLVAADPLVCRSLPVNADAATVVATLAAEPGAQLTTGHAVLLDPSHGQGQSAVLVLVQPVTERRCVIRPVLLTRPEPTNEIETLRHQARAAERFRNRVEAAGADR